MSELVHVKGLEELKAKFLRLSKESGRKVLRPMTAAGARVVKAAVVENIGSDPRSISGTLKRSAIIKFVAAESNETQVEYIVTFRRGKNQQKHGRDAFYAPWVEHGHKIVPRSAKAKTLRGVLRNRRTLRARRSAAGLKFVRPHPFAAPGFERSKQKALDAMIKRGLIDLDKALSSP